MTEVLAAPWVLPVEGPPVRDGAVVAEAGRIRWVGPRRELPEAWSAARVRAFPRSLLLPGFVNAHCHLHLTAMRGRLRGSAAQFTAWLRALISEQSAWPPELFARSTAAGLAALAARGVTLVADMARDPSLEAFAAGPLRARVLLEVIAFPADRAESALDAARRRLDAFDARVPAAARARLAPGLAPHAPYTVSPALLRGLVVLARERRLPVAMHLAETEEERRFLAAGGGEFPGLLRERGAWDPAWRPPGVSPVELAADAGLLELPGAAVHLNYLSDRDIELLRGAQVVPVWCPGSHHWFGHPEHPAGRLLEAGIPVALGTDSLASNTALDVLAELRRAARSFPGVPPATWLRAATVWAARAAACEAETGSLAPGKSADLLVLESPAGAVADPYVALLEGDLAVRAAFVEGREVRVPLS
jgi:cytosine/adenosine deaminase-related metal-dependent hydrolase